ncbi:MAG: hypothetical protein R2759_06420 [Bacteroidales bacterium]
MPKTLDEIMASGKTSKFWMLYAKSPFLTDTRYFFAAFYNIFNRRARSN